jgi:DNA-directed RNA polymerase subunit RPC12/RpoP
MSLLQGVRPGFIENMNKRGIFTLHQLSYTFRPRKIPKRAKNPANPRHYALQAQAIREQKVFIHGAPEIPNTTTSLYFDIEGIPERECFYLIGVLVNEETSSEYHHFWADDDTGQLDMVLQFCHFVSAYPGCVLFHYGSYDQKALRALGSRVNPSDAAIVDKAVDRCCNVLPWVHSHCYFPLHSIKLKTIADFLGFNFAGPIYSGAESIVFREKWEACRDSGLREALLHYNRDDCIALAVVTSFLRNARTLASRRQPVPGRSEEMATSETLRKLGEGNRPTFKKAEFVLPAFDVANRCSYFDYQHERVYARSDKRRRPGKTVLRLANNANRSVRKTIIEVSCDVCPHCGSKQLVKQTASERTFIDLKYFKGQTGVKQWRPNYVIWQYKCRGCGREIVSPTVNFNMRRESRKKYGRGVACWCVYHNVIGKQTVLQVARDLRDFFGIVVPNAYRFRSEIASEYRPLYQEILTAIVESPVINIDETPVKLRKSTGYVWVLATSDKVLYLFRHSREGAFLHELLGDYRGVLISDFFTAYDSLPCFHQKCLVHLMRDLNDDLRRHPFDEELRYIAEEFGGFLQKAVESIDRWGLKAYHLRKHKKDSERLLRNVSREAMKSDCAQKYQSRFTKYRNSLFTFLEHDSVPWNNNNAEHAVHHFAKLRRFTNGTFSEHSIKELLIILTVLQTCEYNRVNPLRFMLSGEVKLSRMG